MNQILKNDQATGASFRVRTGNPTFTGSQDLSAIHHVILTTHAGGTWVLQAHDPDDDDDWLDTDINFTDNGIKSFNASPEIEYRLTGGTIGAKGKCTGVWRAIDP